MTRGWVSKKRGENDFAGVEREKETQAVKIKMVERAMMKDSQQKVWGKESER